MNKSLFVVLAVLSTCSVSAAPVNYDEATDGDITFDDVFNVFKEFNFDFGENSISGSIQLDFDSEIFDFDIYQFVIPTGGQLNSISYQFSNVDTLPGTTILGIGHHFNLITSPMIAPDIVDVISDTSPVSLLDSFLPFTAGLYMYNHGLFHDYPSAGTGGSWDYIMTYDVVSAVPIPGSAWLFGSGLLGLVGMARRKKAA